MNDDSLDKALKALPAPPLDAKLADRVLAVARTELSPPEKQAVPLQLGLALRGALVPALLSVAAVGRTALTVEAAATIYDASPSSAGQKP
jgi:hypothetical protein